MSCESSQMFRDPANTSRQYFRLKQHDFSTNDSICWWLRLHRLLRLQVTHDTPMQYWTVQTCHEKSLSQLPWTSVREVREFMTFLIWLLAILSPQEKKERWLYKLTTKQSNSFSLTETFHPMPNPRKKTGLQKCNHILVKVWCSQDIKAFGINLCFLNHLRPRLCSTWLSKTWHPQISCRRHIKQIALYLDVGSLSQILLIQSLCIGTLHAKYKGFITRLLSKTTRKPKISSLISFSLNYLCQFAIFFMLHQTSELSFYRTLLFASTFFMLSFKEHFPSTKYSHHIKRNTQLQCHPYPPVSTL